MHKEHIVMAYYGGCGVAHPQMNSSPIIYDPENLMINQVTTYDGGDEYLMNGEVEEFKEPWEDDQENKTNELDLTDMRDLPNMRDEQEDSISGDDTLTSIFNMDNAVVNNIFGGNLDSQPDVLSTIFSSTNEPKKVDFNEQVVEVNFYKNTPPECVGIAADTLKNPESKVLSSIFN